MSDAVREIVIWAHSECRSNMALYREVRRQAGVPVTVALWKYGETDGVRRLREAQGQAKGEYSDLSAVPVGDSLERGRELLAAHGGRGTVQVFCVYQNSAAWRRMAVEAKRGGARVVVSAEAPCPMCVGAKAMLKRLYYRWRLPLKVRGVVGSADLFLNASGRSGVAELRRLGWPAEKIVPFGYASDDSGCHPAAGSRAASGGPLKILHTGMEAPYRGVATLERAVAALRAGGRRVELRRTGGKAPAGEMPALYGWADVFVACGICEPWGIRVNDAIHAGLPVVVSRGMGAEWLVGQFGCGATFAPGDAGELASVLEGFADDAGRLAGARAGAMAAHEAWTPAARAAVWLDAVLGR